MRHSKSSTARRPLLRTVLVALGLLASMTLDVGPAAALTDPGGGGGATDGAILRSFTASSPACSIGTGIAFTGEYLLLSCWYTNDLYVIDAADGRLVSTLQVSGTSDTGLGALAYDRRNDALYACTWPSQQVIAIHPNFLWSQDGSGAAVTKTLFTPGGGCIDGLAYDGTDDSFFSSGDVASTVYHYSAAGDVLGTRDIGGQLNGCGNSGLAVGGDELFLANDGCSQIFRVAKTSTDAPSLFASYPERLEDMECDDITFAGAAQTVIWSKDAYDNVLNAFEIGNKDCGYGGYPHGSLVANTPEVRQPVGADATFLITAPQAPADAQYSAPLKAQVLSGPDQPNGLSIGCNISCTISPGASVSVSASGVAWPAPEPEGEGVDLVRVYADLNGNDVWDGDEPFAFQRLWWLRHIDYVALGDSYSAGEGLDPYEDGTDVDTKGPNYNQCHRSVNDAPAVHVSANDGLAGSWIAENAANDMYGTSFAFNACSGATTDNVLTHGQYNEAAQITQAPLGQDTDLVTLSIGGNDIGFGPVLSFCGTTENCDSKVFDGAVLSDLMPARIAALKPKLVSTLAALKDKTTKSGNPATVVLAGYPHLFPDTTAEQTCSKLAGISIPFNGRYGFEVSEQQLMNQASDLLEQTMASAAAQAGALFVNPVPSFTGHAPCDGGTEYTSAMTIGDINDIRNKGLNGLVGSGSFHPTAAGASQYASLYTDTLYNTRDYGFDPTGLPNDPAPRFAMRAAATTMSGTVPVDSAQALLTSAEVWGVGACDTLPSVTQPGGRVRVEADGFAPGATVTLSLLSQGSDESQATPVGSAVATATGHVTGTVTLPAASTPGSLPEVRVTGPDANGYTGTAVGTALVLDKCNETAWPFRGWLTPVENPPTVNVVKAGSAVPLKFGLGEDRGLDILAAAPTATEVSCKTGSDLNQVASTATAGASSLSYDPVTGTYAYVWKTDKAWAGSCRRFTMSLKDGTTHTALFQLQ